MNATPRRIEWTGPEGWTVWADEDGVHLRSRSGDCLESTDLSRLMELIHEAREQIANDRIEPPKPLTKEQARAMYSHDREAYVAKRAQRAIAREFGPDSDAIPF